MKIGIIGMGKIGDAVVRGLQRKHSKGVEIQGTTRSKDSSAVAAKRLGISVHTDNAKLVAGSDVIVLAVKPYQVQKVLEGVKGSFSKGKLLVSVCTGIMTESLFDWSGRRAAVIRAMPNMPCQIGEGMTVLCLGPQATDGQLADAAKIFGAVGRTAVVEENLMDAATGLSASGPAYVYVILEALSEAGVKVGLPRDVSRLLAAQTMMGSAKMVLERGEHPATLKDEVTTPAGTTIDGLMALEEGKLRATLIKAVVVATKRARSLRSPT